MSLSILHYICYSCTLNKKIEEKINYEYQLLIILLVTDSMYLLSYYPEDFGVVIINDKKYIIHKDVLKKIACFESILNDPSSQSELQKGILFPIISTCTPETVNDAIHFLYTGKLMKNDYPLSNFMDIMDLLMEFATDPDELNTLASNMLNKQKIFEELVKIDSFHQSLDIVIQCMRRDIIDDENLKEKFNLLTKSNWNVDNKLKLLEKIIHSRGSRNPREYDIILAVNTFLKNPSQMCGCPGSRTIIVAEDHIRRWYKFFLDQTPRVELMISDPEKFNIFDTKKVEIKLIINRKEIELINYNRTYTPGTYGWNLLSSLSMHTSKIILGLESL